MLVLFTFSLKDCSKIYLQTTSRAEQTSVK